MPWSFVVWMLSFWVSILPLSSLWGSFKFSLSAIGWCHLHYLRLMTFLSQKIWFRFVFHLKSGISHVCMLGRLRVTVFFWWTIFCLEPAHLPHVLFHCCFRRLYCSAFSEAGEVWYFSISSELPQFVVQRFLMYHEAGIDVWILSIFLWWMLAIWFVLSAFKFS